MIIDTDNAGNHNVYNSYSNTICFQRVSYIMILPSLTYWILHWGWYIRVVSTVANCIRGTELLIVTWKLDVFMPQFQIYTILLYHINSIIQAYWVQGSQQQEVKFQDPILENFRTFLSVSWGLRHRKSSFLCAHKCYSLKQISIAVEKMLLRRCYT